MNKNYIPVLCCSGKKTKDIFCYKDESIKFAASSPAAPEKGFVYRKPDDKIGGENRTWRDLVINGQNDPALDLVPAYLLYKPAIYRDLYREFGSRFYILSAGWGIIRADFRIPAYNITYSTAQNVPEYAWRGDNFGWKDINHLKEDSAGFDPESEVILFAGSAYVRPFCDMTESVQYKKKILIYTSKESENGNVRRYHDFLYKDFYTRRMTNWHYEAAEKFLNYCKKADRPAKSTNKESTIKSGNEIKQKYRELCAAYHPDHLDEEDKVSGQRVFCEVQDAWDNKDLDKLENMYLKYIKAKSGDLRRERLEREQQKQQAQVDYPQDDAYNDYTVDQEILHEPGVHRSESKNFLAALIVSISAVVFFANIVQGCPARKKPERSPPPSVEYVLPKSDGSSIVVNSDILTKYFGISYEQRQSSNLFMKDSYEYRYNGNGTWTITKKAAINNTDKNYIDTSNKTEVENYLHSLGF